MINYLFLFCCFVLFLLFCKTNLMLETRFKGCDSFLLLCHDVSSIDDASQLCPTRQNKYDYATKTSNWFVNEAMREVKKKTYLWNTKQLLEKTVHVACCALILQTNIAGWSLQTITISLTFQ
jgi:hypothetical protein